MHISSHVLDVKLTVSAGCAAQRSIDVFALFCDVLAIVCRICFLKSVSIIGTNNVRSIPIFASLQVQEINETKPQCPVYYRTLCFKHPGLSYPMPSFLSTSSEGDGYAGGDTQPYVYLGCGHVHGRHDWTGNNQRNDGYVPYAAFSSQAMRVDRC